MLLKSLAALLLLPVFWFCLAADKNVITQLQLSYIDLGYSERLTLLTFAIIYTLLAVFYPKLKKQPDPDQADLLPTLIRLVFCVPLITSAISFLSIPTFEFSIIAMLVCLASGMLAYFTLGHRLFVLLFSVFSLYQGFLVFQYQKDISKVTVLGETVASLGSFTTGVPLLIISIAAILLSLDQFFKERNAIARCLLITAMAVGVFILFTTKSRIGVLALMSALSLFSWRHIKSAKFIVATVVLGGVWIFLLTGARTSGSVNQAYMQQARESRTKVWSDSLRMAAAHPITGVGIAGVSQSATWKELEAEKPTDSFNQYLNYLCQNGVLYLGLIGFSFVAIAMMLFRADNSSFFSLWIALAILGCGFTLFGNRGQFTGDFMLGAILAALVKSPKGQKAP